MEIGQFQVYTGDGKGKTTAALGLALRAAGAGLRVFVGQFMKMGGTSELASLKKLGVDAEQFDSGKGLLLGREACREDVACAKAGVERIIGALNGGYDVVIADEINCARMFGLLDEGDLTRVIDARPGAVELVFTGRGATPAIIERADLVTEMRMVKHYFAEKGLPARVGVEE